MCTADEATGHEAPYNADLHCKKIAWMVKNSPDWDYEKQTLEEYLETVPEYPTDEQVKDFNHLYVEPFVPFKKEKPYEGEQVNEAS
jgi:hypothetical protein